MKVRKDSRLTRTSDKTPRRVRGREIKARSLVPIVLLIARHSDPFRSIYHYSSHPASGWFAWHRSVSNHLVEKAGETSRTCVPWTMTSRGADVILNYNCAVVKSAISIASAKLNSVVGESRRDIDIFDISLLRISLESASTLWYPFNVSPVKRIFNWHVTENMSYVEMILATVLSYRRNTYGLDMSFLYAKVSF